MSPTLPIVTPLPDGTPPIVRIPAAELVWPPEYEHAWSQMVDANARLHDGPIWSVVDATPRQITVRADQYKRLAIQDAAGVGDLGVRQLGVKGLLVGGDREGIERVLIARRGSETRIYAGMWEIAPGGGVDPRTAPSAATIEAALAQELGEELGFGLPAGTRPTPVALVHDDIARSLDVVLRVDWPLAVTPRPGLCEEGQCSWEYVDAVWIARDELQTFAERSLAAISPPTRAVLGWLGWLTAAT